MKRVITKIGDVFFAALDSNRKKYFQYIANDLTQLNSDVIRVFKKAYPTSATPDFSEVVNEEIDFYAHCVIKWGIQLNLWEKAGHISDVGNKLARFRCSNDYGSKPGEQIKVSHNWRVWEINKPFVQVGRLDGVNQKAEIGVVIPPISIVHRIRTGKYDFEYPGYK